MRERIINVVIILIVLILGIGVTAYYFKIHENDSTGGSKNVTITENNTIKDSVDKVYNATVVIEGYQNGSEAGSGSGFIYKKDGKKVYVMTNHHVISDMDSIKVTTMDGESVDATVLGSDEYMDVAVVQFETSDNIEVVETGDSTKAEIGDTVFTVGTPVGTDYMGTVTKGIISGKDRSVTVAVNNTSYMMEVLQTDASINPGNSGGPLVNVNGEVIGITSMKLVQSSIEGMGFAIPIEMAMSQVDKLENGEKIDRPLFGASLLDVDNTFMLARNGITIDSDITSGSVVAEVEEDSSAEKAGLKKGDVITKVDGTVVKNTAYFRYMLYKHEVGDKMKITYNRNGKEIETTVSLNSSAH